jgi:hypothetical protein
MSANEEEDPMRSFRVCTCVLSLLVASVATPVLAADLVSVSAHVTYPTASPGGADEGTCFVSNSTAGDVRVRLDARVLFSDGKVQRLTGIQDPGVLPAGGAFELDVFFVVPPNAPLGAAQFVCDVTAQSLASRNLRESETQVATFEVVP